MSQYFIKLTAYSGIRVFEMHIHGTPVMRRLRDSYINATQILRAAGLAKPQRTKILEKDVTRGIHDKVQGGYAGFQGTWIPADSAQALGAEYGLEDEIAFLVAQPVDQAIIDAMPQSAPPTQRKSAVRAAAATPARKWSESSEGEPDQAENSQSPGSLSHEDARKNSTYFFCDRA